MRQHAASLPLKGLPMIPRRSALLVTTVRPTNPTNDIDFF